MVKIVIFPISFFSTSLYFLTLIKTFSFLFSIGFILLFFHFSALPNNAANKNFFFSLFHPLSSLFSFFCFTKQCHDGMCFMGNIIFPKLICRTRMTGNTIYARQTQIYIYIFCIENISIWNK